MIIRTSPVTYRPIDKRCELLLVAWLTRPVGRSEYQAASVTTEAIGNGSANYFLTYATRRGSVLKVILDTSPGSELTNIRSLAVRVMCHKYDIVER